MPIHGYPGNIITANPTAPTSSVATGVWTTEQQLQAVSQGNWPGYEYPLERSLRFNSADSAELNRTFGTPTNNKIFTISAWVKTTNPSTGLLDFSFLAVGDAGIIGIAGAGAFGATYVNRIFIRNGSVTGDYWLPVLRDVSAWYHIVIAIDTTQATQADRAKLWINGVSQASNKGASTLSLNATMSVNAASTTHYIGGRGAASYYSSGYLTEYNFIDGQQLEPSSFGLNDPETGVWSAKRYTGTYGTNGFYLNFSDNSGTTSTTLGKDSSGNGNNWTPNNFSVTAGAGNDSLVDTPTNYGTDTGVGGEVRGNYCTLNPLDKGTAATLANGNLFGSTSTTAWAMIRSTFAISSGKWYWEFTVATTQIIIGLAKSNAALANYVGADANGWGWYGATGNKVNGGTQVTYVGVWAANDVIGVSFDADVGTLVFYKNGTSQGTAYTGLTSGPYFPAISFSAASDSANANFGQRAFAYTAPSGFKALCTQNLPTPTIGATSTTQANDYMNVVLYTGNGSTQSITGVGFQPDFVWCKSRSSGVTNHALFDAVRGADLWLGSNLTNAEINGAGTFLTSFNSDGFSVGSGAVVNTNAGTYAAWNWRASNAAGSSNTAGSITSTVSANTTSGFSIISYTGNKTSGATIGHGLGVAPAMVIIKERANASEWIIYHQSLGATQSIYFSTAAANTNSIWFNNTAPSSTVITLGNADGTNRANTMIAYAFAPVDGYSAFGSYTGNASADGPFVYLGFRPAYVLIKRSSAIESWCIMDSKREGYNVDNDPLFANLTNAEGTQDFLDLLSNGFKLRSTDTGVNGSGTYIYAAFAESPFKYALAR